MTSRDLPVLARSQTSRTLLLGALALGMACGEAPPGSPPPARWPASVGAEPGLMARSSGGMVVSGSRLATLAGIEMLEAGGNAMDAAVATAFALAVVEPTQSGLGGRTQVVYRTASGRVGGVDATNLVPAGYDPSRVPEAEYGWSTVAVPGTVAGLVRALEEAGSLPLATVMGPALLYASEGFELPEEEAARLRSAAAELALDEGARRHFLGEDGTPLAAGERWVQPALAEVLRQVGRDGAAAFYTGDIARHMARDMEARGGFVTPSDLADYRTRGALLVEGRYRDLDLVGTYLPASGATTIQALQILEHFEVGAMDEADWASVVAQALLLAFRDRDEVQRDDPGEAARRLVSPEQAAALAREVRVPGSFPASAPPASSPPAPAPSPPAADREPPFTTHVSTADREGMLVALTQSLGPTAGARVASPELGFLYAVTMGGYLGEVRPGERPWSSQSPMMALRDGRPVLVLGGAGARRIISAAVQTVSRWADQGMEVEAAMAAPRFHPSPGSLVLEEVESAPWPTDTASRLEEAGFRVSFQPGGSWFARLNVIRRDGDGFTGIADGRWPGGGAGGPGR